MSRLTDINGVELQSEHEDPVLYNVIRSLQFLFLHTYSLWDKLKIEEEFHQKSFFYCIENQKLNLRGYIGRNFKDNKIGYLVVDFSRIEWMKKEGFDLTIEIKNNIGYLLKLPTMNDFILYMAGRIGWDHNGYSRLGDS
jgi:hypothetical protein